MSSPAESPGAGSPGPASAIIAFAVGGALVGLAEGLRLRSAALVATLVPLFALTGLLAGAIATGAAEVIARPWRGRERWWVMALARAVPSLLVLIPVSATLFDGAYAHTLPAARALPVVLPVIGMLAIAGAIALGTWMIGLPIGRAVVALSAVAVALTVELATRRITRFGYPDAHLGAALTIIVLVGVALRVAWPYPVRARTAAAVAAVICGAAIAAMLGGLRTTSDRLALASLGDDGRHLVRAWRAAIDFDRDGFSAILGGGDCDDFDARIHPGARDLPGDGIDQDCDGVDATRPPPPPAVVARAPGTPPPIDLPTWRATPAVRDLLARTQNMNVILVSVDALRLDMLGPDAPGRADYPRLTALLDQSVWFTHAISPAAGTDVSLSTLLTGRFDPYQPVDTTLPEAMRASGRRTTAAIPGEVLRYVGDTLIGRGEDKLSTVYTDWAVADVGDHVSASATTAEALKALDAAAGKPSFVWAHYFDVHEHHQIEVPAELLGAVTELGGNVQFHRYRALLLAIDREVGHLLDELVKRGLDDHTIIVFVSDHGEGLGDDSRLPDTHGQVAYATLTRVPFALRIPGVAGARRTDPASLVDLAPTLLDLIGTPTAIVPLDGLDLVPALLDAPAHLRAPGRSLIVHEEQQWAVVEWPYQLLVRPADATTELYDLDADPGEHTDLAATHPDIVSRLAARYAEVPEVKVDRSPAARQWREQQAQPPPRHAPS